MKTFGKAVVWGFGFMLGKSLYRGIDKAFDRRMMKSCEWYRKAKKKLYKTEDETEVFEDSRPVMGFRG